jgi:hypothetical protein
MKKIAAKKAQITKQLRRANRNGYAVIELPVVLWCIFVSFVFPLLLIASIGIRSSILFFNADTACLRACKATSYTEASQRATDSLKNDLGTFNGISNISSSLSIIVKPLSGANPTIVNGKLAQGSIDSSKNLYFLLLFTEADIDPLVRFDTQWMGLTIPGLTEPYKLRLKNECYSENPNGLTE